MTRICLIICLALLLTGAAHAKVELARSGQPPQVLTEVYLHKGVPYLALDDALPALGLSGYWDSVAHVYQINTPNGRVTISPGSKYLRRGEMFIPLAAPPKFIDGRLRIAEDFITAHLPRLLGEPVYYRNLNPPALGAAEEGSSLDRLFAFLLRKKQPSLTTQLRAVAIDPGHGGQDPGSLGLDGSKEKTVTLAMARQLEKHLKMSLGIPVYLSRNDDYELSAKDRLAPALKPDVDALLLLHAQASFSPEPSGIRLYIRPEQDLPDPSQAADTGSRQLAELLEQTLQENGFQVRGIQPAPLLPLGRGDLPTVLVELGYLTNPADHALLTVEAAREELAAALFAGLKQFAEQKESPR